MKKFWWVILIVLFLAGCLLQVEHKHEHDEDCYIDSKQLVLNCDYQVHEHGVECYDSTGNLICSDAEFVMHRHDNTCFDDDDVLVCDLTQIWWEYRDVLLCSELHEHDSDCYENRRVLVNLDCDAGNDILRIADDNGWFRLTNLHEHQHTVGGMCFDIAAKGYDDILVCDAMT